MPSAHCAIRGSLCWVAASGGGVGAWDSQVRNDLELWIGRDQLTQRGGPGARQTQDDDRAVDHLVGDLGMLFVGLDDLQPLDQRVADGRVLHDPAEIVELGFGVQRGNGPHRDLRGSRTIRNRRGRWRRGHRLPVRQRKNSPVEPFVYGATTGFDHVCAFFGVVIVVPGGNADRTSPTSDHARVAVPAQFPFARNVIAWRHCCGPPCPASSPPPDPSRTDDGAEDAVGIDDRLMSVKAGLIASVMNRLQPRIAQRDAPIDALWR